MTSYEGVLRGAKGENPDDPHLFTEEPIRLYDAPSLEVWRERGFCTVIDRTAPPTGAAFRFGPLSHDCGGR